MFGRREVDFIYFDLGHVIVPVGKEKVAKLLAGYTPLGYDGLMKIFGHTYPEFEEKFWETVCEFDRGDIYPHEFFARVKKIIFLDDNLKLEAFIYAWQMMLSVDARFLRLIRSLRRAGIRCGIISDLCVVHFNRFREMMPQNFFDIRFFSFFEGILKRDNEGEVFLRAIRAANLPPHKILFIDDLPVNIEMAKKHGMRTFLYSGNFDGFVLHLRDNLKIKI
jgi:glucose-1-phosphatase